jgi:hypothetical protein
VIDVRCERFPNARSERLSAFPAMTTSERSDAVREIDVSTATTTPFAGRIAALANRFRPESAKALTTTIGKALTTSLT